MATSGRIDLDVCNEALAPGVDPKSFPANFAVFESATPVQLTTADRVDTEPPLRCYVINTCPSGP